MKQVLAKLSRVQFFCNQIGIPVPLDHIMAGKTELGFDMNRVHGDDRNGGARKSEGQGTGTGTGSDKKRKSEKRAKHKHEEKGVGSPEPSCPNGSQVSVWDEIRYVYSSIEVLTDLFVCVCLFMSLPKIPLF